MDRKFIIILLATVFYNGVTQSSPVGQQISDARLPEEKPPTVQPPTVDHLNKKIETVSVPSTKPSVPVVQSTNQTAVAPHAEEPATKNTSPEKATTALPTVDGKNTTSHDAINKNATIVVDNKTTNATIPVDNKNSTHVVNNKNGTIPATGKNTTETPVATPAGPTTTSSSTSAATPAPSTTVTTPKPTATTVVPSTTTTKDSVIAEQSTTAPPAQENHFHVGSFVGGIVLSMGLAAILFIAIKYYKSGKIDMSYRTL